MKNRLLLLAFSFFTITTLAQDAPEPTKAKKKLALKNRPNDHLLIQLGYTDWTNKPDSVNPSGLSKSINAYFMFDFPFKNSPKLSMAFGPGISSDHIIFKKTYVGIKERTPTIPFTDLSDTNHYKKTKLATVYLEAPIEFRYTANAYNADKSFKFAIGVKVGTMISAQTRNAKFESRNGSLIHAATVKEKNKDYFNKNRLVATARIGWGHFSLYGSYQLTNLFRDGAGPEVKPFSVGITLSGL